MRTYTDKTYDLLLSLDPKITVITGPNGSGKSTILKGIKQSSTRNSVVSVDSEPDPVDMNGTKFWFLQGCPLKEDVRAALDTLLKTDQLSDFQMLYPEVTEMLGVFGFNHPRRGVLKLADTGKGIRRLVDIVCKVACFLKNKKGTFAEAKGMLLIDDVELHLHPRMQQQILHCLREIFPKMQIVVTTHSPIVVATVKASSVRMMVEMVAGNYGVCLLAPGVNTMLEDINNVLSNVLETFPRADIPAMTLLHRYEQWVRAGKEKDPTAVEMRKQLRKAGIAIKKEEMKTWRLLSRAGLES
jgi:predicted ATP-binding protein involved in virulence